MATASGGVMTDLLMTPTGAPVAGGRSQHHQKSQNQKRPPRACTARTPSRLAPLAPSVGRTTPLKQQPQHNHQRGGGGDADPRNTPMALTSPPPPAASPAQKQRWLLRSMWELASVIHFLNVFRPVLNLKFDFSMEELESALLTPNALLDNIHIALLKAIPPISRTPINRETWVTVLCKKMKEWWHWVAEGPFPLVPYHGEENATYKELGPDARAIILKALCEVRLDQEDMRIFIDEMLKQGAPYSSVRKERTGNDMQGTTYWYENDPVAGQRLYRELRRSDNKDKPKVRGRLMPPPTKCHWETLATNLDEFQTVVDKLCSSRSRMEVAIGKRINNDIVPNLKDLQKKKERALKKQQRQALLLDSYFNTEGLVSGRPKRERKPVTYTFDDYDKSISEAIKITKRRHGSPESLVAGEIKLSNGFTRQQSDEEVDANHSEDQPVTESASQSKLIETTSQLKPIETTTHSSESDFSGDGQYGRGRRHRRPQRYVESDFVDTVSENEAGASSEDDIEGEAVYDDDYVSKKKRRFTGSSDGDEEYRGDEEEEEEEEDGDDEDDSDDEEDYMGSSDEGEYVREERYPKNIGSGRRRGKVKAVEELQGGLRRSQRATRSHVDYSKYEESDMEGDEHVGDTNSPERADCDRVENLANSCENIGDSDVLEPGCTAVRPGDSNDLVEGDHDSKDFQIGEAAHRTPMNGIQYEPQADIKPGNRLHRFLDLNVAAPVGGGQDDSSAGCSRGQNQSSPYLVSKFENSGDDGSTCDSPKTVVDWPIR